MDTKYLELYNSLKPASLQNLHLLTTTKIEYDDLVKFCDAEQDVGHGYTIAALFEIANIKERGHTFKETQDLVVSFLDICNNYRLLKLPTYESEASEVTAILRDKMIHEQIDNILKKLLKLLEQIIENELLLRLNAVKLGEDTATGFKLCYDELKSPRTDKTSDLYKELLTNYEFLYQTLIRYLGEKNKDLLDINKLHMLMSYYKKATDMIKTILDKLLDLLESFRTGEDSDFDQETYEQLETGLNDLQQRMESGLLSNFFKDFRTYRCMLFLRQVLHDNRNDLSQITEFKNFEEAINTQFKKFDSYFELTTSNKPKDFFLGEGGITSEIFEVYTFEPHSKSASYARMLSSENISFVEFERWLAKQPDLHDHASPITKLKTAWSTVDTGGIGSLGAANMHKVLNALGIMQGEGRLIQQMFSTTQNPLVCFGAEYLMILLAQKSAFTNSKSKPIPLPAAVPAVPAAEDQDVTVDLMINLFLTEAFNNKDSSHKYIQVQKLATSISKLFFEQEQQQSEYKMNHFSDWCSKFANQRLESMGTLLEALRDRTSKNQELAQTSLRSLEGAARRLETQLTDTASAQAESLRAVKDYSQKQAENTKELFELAQNRTEKLNAQADILRELHDINKKQAAMLSETLQTTLGNSMSDLFEVYGKDRNRLTFLQQAEEPEAFTQEQALDPNKYIIPVPP
tara:strand:+ start:77 stop:2140 length:2064 start_codon:yes stop_codon:yes gene_type:complete